MAFPAAAIFQNGGFESGNFSGWTTGSGVNNGSPGHSRLRAAASTSALAAPFRGAVVTAGPDLKGRRWRCRTPAPPPRVNNTATGGIANFISQADTITNADRDSSDNKLHVRFSYAVVLNDGGHAPTVSRSSTCACET